MDRGSMDTARTTAVAGLVVGAAGIAVMWASGVQFPIAIPPGIVILLAGALFVTFCHRRWAPVMATLLGLFVFVGFLASPTGIPNLMGEAGASVAIGQGIQILGVLTAIVAGITATRSGFRTPVRG